MSHALSRRTVLRAAGASLALPFLEAMRPASARSPSAAGGGADAVPRRMAAVNFDMGFMPEYFFPEQTGRGYAPSRYLAPLADRREDFTVFSGVSHPEVDGGHAADVSFLTGAPHPLSSGFRNSISLDQYAAQRLGPQTRFPSLTLRVGPEAKSLSYTADGVRIPAEEVPSAVYEQLFVDGTPDQVRAQVRRLKEGQSLMDSFGGEIDGLKRRVGGADRDRLDQYLTAVREVERRLHQGEQWETRPKPAVAAPAPKDNLDPGALFDRTRAMYDLTRLAFETDSTRLVTIIVAQAFNPVVDLPGVDLPHHSLTHQSQQKDSRAQLEAIETAQMAELGRLLDGLAGVTEGGERLLDRTMVLHGSNLGHANRHANTNMPMLLAGGGFRHGQHLAFDRDRNRPLGDLYVSMLQRLGIETDRFATGTATLTGLEMT